MRNSGFGIREIVSVAKRNLTSVAAAATLCCLTGVADAQVQNVTPPLWSSVDDLGVDASTGQFHIASTEVVIGQSGAGGLSHGRIWIDTGWRDSLAGTISNSGSVYAVSLGQGAETFTLSSGTYSSNMLIGSTLTFASSKYTYTLADGTVAEYDTSAAGCSGVTSFWACNAGLITKLTRPDGEILTWTYASATAGGQTARRPQAISNNLGYQIHFTYSNNSPANSTELTGIWLQRTKVTGINRAYYYCADTATTCSDSTGGNWPYVTYGTESSGAIQTVTNRLSEVTRYVTSGGKITGIRLPTSSSVNRFQVTYTSGKVSNVTGDLNRDTDYAYADASGVRTTTITPLEGGASVVKTNLTNGWVTDYWADTSGTRKTVLTRDGNGRITRTTRADGDYTNLTYDGRGNVTQIIQSPKTGSGLSTITTSADYSASCSNAKTCNKPNSTTDARGYRTDYTYDSTHGGITAVTSPAPSGSTPVGSGTQPQARYAYTQLNAWYKNSGGSLVSASGVYRLTSTSACATGSSPSCVGTSDETRNVVDYEAGSGSVASNLLPVTATARSGNASGSGAVSSSATSTYTVLGDVATIDGPLSGASDTSYLYYDDVRRLRASVTLDPDGGGTLQHRVVKTTYDADGKVTATEVGHVSSPASWSSLTVLMRQDLSYSNGSMLAKAALSSSGTTHSVVQFGVGLAFSRCTAVRMNPSEFASLTANACALDTTGSFGPDRITQTSYDLYAMGNTLTSGVGVNARNESVQTRGSSDGVLDAMTDAALNRTEYVDDGFSRLVKTIYPDPSTINTANTSDYEQLTYDSIGRLTARRGRDGQSFAFSYDNLYRLTSADAPGSQPDVSYTYDNLGRVLTVSQSGHTITYTYDALSRLVSENNSLIGTTSYEYDAAGRRTRLTWPDSFYVTYDYNVAGEVTAIRENGAASGAGVLATFTYDNLGRRSSATRGNGSTTGYAYDGASRLIDLGHDLGGGASDIWTDLSYNPAGEIVSRTINNASYNNTLPSAYNDSYAVNGLNHYTSASGVMPTYDSRGNTTNDGTKSYTYDYSNRMITAGSATLAYDPQGRLYSVAGSTTVRFAYDGADMIAEYNTSGVVVRRYVHGPGIDEPIVWYEGSNTTDRRHLFADERGSIITVEGSTAMRNTYDEYGIPGSGNAGRFQYTGQIWLADAGLYHYKARAYNPELGRFMQTDPIGTDDQVNLYAYVGDDPINHIDPFGLECWDAYVEFTVEYGEGAYGTTLSYQSTLCWDDEPWEKLVDELSYEGSLLGFKDITALLVKNKRATAKRDVEAYCSSMDIRMARAMTKTGEQMMGFGSTFVLVGGMLGPTPAGAAADTFGAATGIFGFVSFGVGAGYLASKGALPPDSLVDLLSNQLGSQVVSPAGPMAEEAFGNLAGDMYRDNVAKGLAPFSAWANRLC